MPDRFTIYDFLFSVAPTLKLQRKRSVISVH